MKTTVCIPAYNESKLIGEIIRRSKKIVDQVVVCDDGSTDETAKIASEAGAKVIRHEKNFGKGKAIKTLFDYVKKSNSDIVVTIDGDGQFLPEEIPKLIALIKNGKADVVTGYRFDNTTEMPLYRKIGNKMLDKITNLATDLPFRDTQGGFRAYSKKAIDTIEITSTGFGVDSEILIDASKKGLKILEEKITVIYNTGNKTSTKDPFSHSIDVTTSLIELIAIKHPLKFLGIPGLVLMVIGIIFAIIVITIFNESRYFSIPSTLVSLGSLSIGLMLLLMAIVLFSIRQTGKRIT